MSWWDPRPDPNDGKDAWGLPGKRVKTLIQGKPLSPADTLNDAARQLLTGNHEVQGRAMDRTGQYVQPDVEYTNPVLAFLNDARTKAARMGLLPQISPDMADKLRPNAVQSPSDAQPNAAAANGMAVVNQAAANATGIASMVKALKDIQDAKNAAAPSVGDLFGLGGLTDSLTQTAQKLGQMGAAGAYPTIPNGGDTVGHDGGGEYNVNLPNIPMPTAPAPVEFKRNDFSDQANKMVGDAYGPQYQALSEAVDSAKKQGTQQDQLLAGLYTQLVNADKSQGAAVDARYGKDIAAAQGNVKTRAADAAAGYNSTAQSQAKMLQDMGMGDAAAELLKQGVADSGWAQNQAKTQANAQADYLTDAQNTQGDWYSGMANADQTTGLAARQQNGRDTNDVLGQLDQQKLGIASSQSQDALQYGNDLSAQDLQIQQANYGVGQDAYTNALNAYKTQQDQQLQQAQLQLQAQGMSSDDAYKWAQLQQQQNMAQYQQQVDARNDAYGRQRDANSDAQWRAGYDLDQTKYTTDAAAQAAQIDQEQQKINQSGSGSGVDPTADQTALAQIAQIDPQNAGHLFQIAQKVSQDPGYMQGGITTFIAQVQNEARAAGLDPGTAVTAANAYWNNILKGNMVVG